MEEHSAETHGSDSSPTLGERFEDERGWIQNLAASGWVSIIQTKAGERRSSHWHRTDSHYLYVLSGEMSYFERPVGSADPPGWDSYKAGQMVFTGPNVEHWTYFPVDTVLVSVSQLHRTHDAHEQDVVRIPWHE